ncbi:MAG: twitching motility protein PilT [Lachnospiraceae bacterium]|nr:twitching motility protein PilT [Lachnospiraceae bacterium]
MIEIVTGEKGKGKTKVLLDQSNEDIKTIDGSIIFIDKSSKHMYDLDSKVRLINISEYPVNNTGEFLGFLSGVISQNNDIEEMFLDSYLTIAYIDTDSGLESSLEELEKISECFGVKFVISVSRKKEELPSELQSKVIASL